MCAGVVDDHVELSRFDIGEQRDWSLDFNMHGVFVPHAARLRVIQQTSEIQSIRRPRPNHPEHVSHKQSVVGKRNAEWIVHLTWCGAIRGATSGRPEKFPSASIKLRDLFPPVTIGPKMIKAWEA